MKPFKTSLESASTETLKAMSQEYRDLIIAMESTDQLIRDRLFCIEFELVYRAVNRIPNAEKFEFNRTTGLVSVYFSPVQSKQYNLTDLIKGA